MLRAQPGQLYELSDGQQSMAQDASSELLSFSSRGGNSMIEFALVEPIATREPALQLQLLLSIVKFDRFEWSLEKATELGVTEIVPLAAARTDKALLAAAGKRHARWEKILVESAQQSRRLRPPEIGAATSAEKSFAGASADVKIVLSERADAPLLKLIYFCATTWQRIEVPRQRSPEIQRLAGNWPRRWLDGRGDFSGSSGGSSRKRRLEKIFCGLKTGKNHQRQLAVLQFTLGD